ncbi:hypothetical protein B0H16DRAFT_1578706 [Mycena metata]|uniref:GATA-type domain-containing protein n=1 Tax=Mycena metata TaxID=1033252 RepID=A0AAD7MWM3_9AGAR|nr:hypothetical protein B0H16DRAFT_1578706 [Mycena metata]
MARTALPRASPPPDRSDNNATPPTTSSRRSPAPIANNSNSAPPSHQPQYQQHPYQYPGPTYMYAPPPPPPQYAHHPQPHAQHPSPYGHPYGGHGYVPYPFPPPPSAPNPNTNGGAAGEVGAGPGIAVIHTDDAATKLSDRVRRRCFNCCTTETSTWRRSNLSPGKVLCNKCGLFERTHSRPRPEQFPHKRASTLQGGGGQPQVSYQPYPPPNAEPPLQQQQKRQQDPASASAPPPAQHNPAVVESNAQVPVPDGHPQNGNKHDGSESVDANTNLKNTGSHPSSRAEREGAEED